MRKWKWSELLERCAGVAALVGLPFFFFFLSFAAINSQHAPGPDLNAEPPSLDLSYVKTESKSRPSKEEIMGWGSAGSERTHQIQTMRSEEYFVFSGHVETPRRLYFTSRHVVDMVCYDQKGNEIGQTGYKGPRGGFDSFSQGNAIRVDGGLNSALPFTFICAQKSSGPAKIVVQSLDFKTAAAVQMNHVGKNWALAGAIGLLIIFMLLTGVVNKDWRYALLSAWLLMALRTAQLNMGTDAVWFGLDLDPANMPRLRMVTIAIYLGLLFPLVRALLGQGEKTHAPKALEYWTSFTSVVLGALVIGSIFLPFKLYLPLMWFVVLNTVANLTTRFGFLIARRITRSENVLWLSAGLVIPMFSWVSEVVAAALGYENTLKWLNNENAAVLSALLVTMAFAQQLKSEKKEKTQAKEDLKRSYDSSPMGLFEADVGGWVAQGNPAVARMLGESVSSQWSMASHIDAAQWQELVDAAKASSQPVDRIVAAISSDGLARYFDARVQINIHGRVEGSLQDATERMASKERLEFLAYHDPLTECLNLRGLERVLDQVDANKGAGAMVAYFDLDRFKLVNDVYGHEAGDAVLREVRDRLSYALGPAVSLGRVGGDEFLALFHGQGMDQAQSLCDSALRSIADSPFEYGTQSFRLSASAGLVEAAAVGAETSRALIGAADSACRMAKSQGRDQLVAYGRDSMFYERRLESYHIAKLLESDVALAGLRLVGQPIMALESPFDSLNFEVLLRMTLPDGREVGAGPLIETAEAHGQIAKVDLWVLSTILKWIGENRARLGSTRFICVNLSGGSVNDEAFLDKVFELFRAHPVDATMLCVEITESVALRDLDNTRIFVERARSLGVRVALDDFGAGYSSFGYLKELPADALKIDGALVRDAMRNPASQSILVALAGLSTALGMRSIGEWTEDAEMVKMLAMAGFDYAQGYAIAKPMPLDELAAASSCADLIKDPETARYARALQHGAMASLEAAVDSQYLH